MVRIIVAIPKVKLFVSISSLNNNHFAMNVAVGGIPESVIMAKNRVRRNVLLFIKLVWVFTPKDRIQVTMIRLEK